MPLSDRRGEHFMYGNGTRKRRGEVRVELDPPTIGELFDDRALRTFRVEFHLVSGRQIDVTAGHTSVSALSDKIMGLDWWVLRDDDGAVTGGVNLAVCEKFTIVPL